MGHCRIPHRMHLESLALQPSVSEDVPPTSSTCGEPWYRQDLQGANTPQKVKVQDLPTSSRFENGCCKLRSRVTNLSEKLTEHEESEFEDLLLLVLIEVCRLPNRLEIHQVGCNPWCVFGAAIDLRACGCWRICNCASKMLSQDMCLVMSLSANGVMWAECMSTPNSDTNLTREVSKMI
jgi:hypothetical protein